MSNFRLSQPVLRSLAIASLLGVAGSVIEFTGRHLAPWWWAWLSGWTLTVMIAAVPVAKARLLANSRAVIAALRAQEGTAAATFHPLEWNDGREDEGVV